MIGERINPTGRKIVLQALQEGNFEIVRQDAIAQVEAGATVLDVNAGVPGADEVSLLSQVMQEVMAVVDVSLTKRVGTRWKPPNWWRKNSVSTSPWEPVMFLSECRIASMSMPLSSPWRSRLG